MTSKTYQLPLNYEQILTLVKQLPDSEKRQLNQELEKDLNSPSIKSRTKAFSHLIQQVQPVSPDFDPQQAKDEYLQEKYNW